MNLPLWVSEAADAFWTLACAEEPFPRALRHPIADALQLSIVQLPRLRLRATGAWLRSRGIVCDLDVGDHPLQAALVARYGQGFLFVDGGDPDDEQRISVAHELAHFLRHYLQLRQRVKQQLGVPALAVLDGERPPSRSERIHALLANVPFGYYVHLMQRGSNGQIVDGSVAQAEREADRLAYELLAPAAVIEDAVTQIPANVRREATAEILRERYGFPERSAADYAAILIPAPRVRDRIFGNLSVVK